MIYHDIDDIHSLFRNRSFPFLPFWSPKNENPNLKDLLSFKIAEIYQYPIYPSTRNGKWLSKKGKHKNFNWICQWGFVVLLPKISAYTSPPCSSVLCLVLALVIGFIRELSEPWPSMRDRKLRSHLQNQWKEAIIFQVFAVLQQTNNWKTFFGLVVCEKNLWITKSNIFLDNQ